nr:uncharacterized protein K02A2.6-like [Onthophagus taurus]
MWMIIVDAYSKWIEIEEMNNITTASTIKVMKSVFARFGLPKTLVTDNGPQLVSSDFEDFCKSQGIKHVRITPYHPKSNGQAERVVKTFKDRLNSSDKNFNLHDRLCKFLMSYRNTPQRGTGRTPSDLIFGRPARIIFDQLKPDVGRKLDNESLKQKMYYDKQHVREKFFELNDPVWINNPLTKGSTPGNILKQSGPYSYLVDVNGIPKRKHADQMRHRYTTEPETSSSNEIVAHDNTIDKVPTEIKYESRIEVSPNEVTTELCSTPVNTQSPTPTKSQGSTPISRRNPPRNRQIPVRFRDN